MAKPTTIKHVGQVLKALRKEKGLTGEELGRRVGLSQSMISKIETSAGANLKHKEVMQILNILDASKTIQQQIYDALSRFGTSKAIRFPLYGNTRFYTLPLKVEHTVKQTKLFIFNSVPALLQTVEYRRAGLKNHFGLSEEEISKSIKIALKRQDYLWDHRRKFHIIMHQAALYFMRGSRAVQMAQLDRIERLMDLPNLRIGIIPVEAGLPLAEHGSFVLWDDTVLTNATAGGDVYIHDKAQVALHITIFAELDRLAYYDNEAKQQVRRAMDYFI